MYQLDLLLNEEEMGTKMKLGNLQWSEFKSPRGLNPHLPSSGHWRHPQFLFGTLASYFFCHLVFAGVVLPPGILNSRTRRSSHTHHNHRHQHVFPKSLPHLRLQLKPLAFATTVLFSYRGKGILIFSLEKVRPGRKSDLSSVTQEVMKMTTMTIITTSH